MDPSHRLRVGGVEDRPCPPKWHVSKTEVPDRRERDREWMDTVHAVAIHDSQPDVQAAILDLLADGEVWDETQLVLALDAGGIELGPDPEGVVAELLDEDELPLVVHVDSGYALLSALLRDRTFTHRLTAGEVARDLLVIGSDLAPLWCLTDVEEYRRLTDGTEFVELVRGYDDDVLADRGDPADLLDDFVWMFPEGTARRLGLVPGSVIGVKVHHQGFEIVHLTEPQRDAEELGALLADQLGQRGEGEPDEVSDLVWEACAADRDLFVTPEPPISVALDAARLELSGDLVGPPGFDFPAWGVGKQVARIGALHRLREDEALAVLGIRQMYDVFVNFLTAAHAAAEDGRSVDDLVRDELLESTISAPKGNRTPQAPTASAAADLPLIGDLISFLNDPGVTEAVLVETMGTGRAGAAALGLLAETLEPQVPRASRAPLRWLRAKALERLGEVLEAETVLESVLEIDADHLLTLYDLARFASDRGNAERGLSLLRRAKADGDDGLVELLTSFQTVERSDLGRNDPCWCGSGRKYKVCHRGRQSQPLAERAAWLYQKAGTYLSEGPWRDRLIDLVQLRVGFTADESALWDALNEGLASDVLLFEGGAFEEFVAERGELLPDDERLLAAQWLLVERSVHEIESVTPGVGFLARDVRTGDRLEVRERTASRSLCEGELICARIVPAGDSVQIFGSIEKVGLGERDAVIALLDEPTGPDHLVELLSARFAPPRLQNTEGDPLVLCEATLHSQDPQALAELLDSAYDRPDEDPRWFEFVTTHGMNRIRATLELTGSELQVEVNSEARLDRVLDKVRGLQPGVVLISQSRVPASEAMEMVRRMPTSPAAPVLDVNGPEAARVLAEFVRAQEEAWLDEPIPALAGATPRDAAADPTRRPDLLRLLDSYAVPSRAGVMGMDVGRLRTALGLG